MTKKELSENLLKTINEQIEKIRTPNSKVEVLYYYIYKLHDMIEEIRNTEFEDYSKCPFCNTFYIKGTEIVKHDVIDGGMLEEDIKYDEIEKYCPHCKIRIFYNKTIKKREDIKDDDEV